MGKEFTRVKDPERLKEGDLLVVPAAPKPLGLGTLSRCGMSIGFTDRSRNDATLVSHWLAGTRPGPKVFLAAGVNHRPRESEEQLLLGLDAVKARDPEDPRMYAASLVPFGPLAGDLEWSWRQWAGCWNDVTGGAVAKRLAELCGDGMVLGSEPGKDGAPAGDLAASCAWDNAAVTGLDHENKSDDWFPTVRRRMYRSGGENPFALRSLMDRDDNGYLPPKKTRMYVSGAFLVNLVKRGAYVLRPSEGFRDAVTTRIAGECMDELRRRFLDRIASARKFAALLAADVRRDCARAKRLLSLARVARGGARPLARSMLRELGVKI